MPFPQPTERPAPHPFQPSSFGSEKTGVLCAICGASERNDLHGPQPATDGRLSRIDYLWGVVSLTAERSTCRRAKVGAIIVREGRLVASGYNGSPPGMPHCIDVGCEPEDGCERTVHAEANAIAWAARSGIATAGATMMCSHGPCRACAQLILAAGIYEFHFMKDYRLQRLDILMEGGVVVPARSLTR